MEIELNNLELKGLIQSIISSKRVYYPLFFLTLHNGLRMDEVLAAKWKNIDWSKLIR